MSEYVATEFDLASTEFISEYEEIVRCRDCRHFAGREGLCMRLFNAMAVEPHGFCAWGSRRGQVWDGTEVDG